ncbi:MAG: transglutaminase family protein [Rhodoferax sp.]|nr:transglutaminase family protein [Rhodoferax sp.]
MTLLAHLHHLTRYQYDRAVNLGPHIVRLHPAPHCRTPIGAYSLTVRPSSHFIHWQQDPLANRLARLVFTQPCTEFEVEVDLSVTLTELNPFDFFLDPSANAYPFSYSDSDQRTLAPYLSVESACGAWPRFLDLARELDRPASDTVQFLIAANQRIARAITYGVRHEAGVQTPEQSLELGSGSCRDSSWLLVQLFRRLGLAARFVSGYLIDVLVSAQGDVPGSPDLPSRSELHAWCEVYLPGAGWIGMDPTSGLLTGAGHIALACALDPAAAAPVEGRADIAEVRFSHRIDIQVSKAEVPK